MSILDLNQEDLHKKLMAGVWKVQQEEEGRRRAQREEELRRREKRAEEEWEEAMRIVRPCLLSLIAAMTRDFHSQQSYVCGLI